MSKQSDLVSVSQGASGDPLYIDTTNDRVGVGTSSPSTLAHLKSSGDYAALTIETATTGGASYINLGDSNDLDVGQIAYYNSDDSLRIKVNAAERMRIDSAGRVTMPYQPAFKASRLSGNVGPGNTFIFNDVNFNTGGHYNGSTGRFTAPVSGVYQFNVIMLTTNTNPSGHYYWRVLLNGSTSFVDAYSHNDTANTYVHYPASFSLYLSSNDYIEIYISAGTFYAGNLNSLFSGYLVG
jgi:hypothetical protein